MFKLAGARTRFRRCNRAVEPIISALVLIVITVLAFSLVYGAYSNWINVQRRDSLMEMQERIAIEAVQFNWNSPQKSSVYLANIGKSQVKIIQVMVNQSSASITPPADYIIPGNSAWINFTYTGDFLADNIYQFTLISERGIIAETFEKR